MRRWRRASWGWSKLAFHVTLPGKLWQPWLGIPAPAATSECSQSPVLHRQSIPGLSGAQDTVRAQCCSPSLPCHVLELWCPFPAPELAVCWALSVSKVSRGTAAILPNSLCSRAFWQLRWHNRKWNSSGFVPSPKPKSRAGKVCAWYKFAVLPMQSNFLKLQVSKTHPMHFLNFTELVHSISPPCLETLIWDTKISLGEIQLWNK